MMRNEEENESDGSAGDFLNDTPQEMPLRKVGSQVLEKSSQA